MSLIALRYDDDNNDVLSGLRSPRKRLPCRLLYADAGAELFERICTLDAYYPTRTELALLDRHLAQIAGHVGPAARVIEPGSGEGKKTRMLLRALDAPSSYVPIDIARDQLHRLAAQLRAELPELDVAPVAADYSEPFELPVPQRAVRRTLVFFPGSTIGNFEPGEARQFLARLAALAGDDRLLLLGADATRDPAVLARAYDDEHGVTAAFNKNVLAHLNRSLGATFDLDAFDHRAVWNAAASRVEMHLVSTRSQVVRIAGEQVRFVDGEPIVTEHCYKHTPAAIHALLATAGWRPRQVFTSQVAPFRLWLCEPLVMNRV
ncbi:MAG TPA: L-histidine N(alpha)-methyltransferase [Kofleriaceae bacterium]|nr:L-histidine N(alpha)-methyltransferase [Kofleriaceae bacterium]